MLLKLCILICISIFDLYIFFYGKYFFIFFLKSFHLKKKHSIVIVFGTRPEAIKLMPIIKLLKNNKKFLCVTINTGQHTEMVKQIIEILNMSDSIDIELNIMKNNQTLPELTSKIMIELNKIYSLLNPDAVIVQGDTTSSFAAALSAFYQKIAVFHVEAGLRTNNLYSPFPEEFNRVAIDDISTLYFASTELAASNLVKENKNQNNIFITGNTVVDALKLTLEKSSPSKLIHSLLQTSQSRCKYKDKNCKIILLTCHRRENYYKPIANILNAVKKLLEDFEDIVIILPFHLNPNVIESIKKGLPENIFNEIIDGKIITDQNYLFFNRFLIIKPLNYIDLIHLQKSSFFIMTDSGGIQEESISIGKPVLILRENTERLEGILGGSAILTGTSPHKIYYYSSLLLKNSEIYAKMAKPHNIYGSGNSSVIIVNLIEKFFDNKLMNTNYNFSKTINNLNDFHHNSLLDNEIQSHFDLVIVLTVWKRNNLNAQLMQIKRQSILKQKKTNIIVFQNFYHINIDKIIEEWKKPNAFSEQVIITFIKSPIETGYFGRFIAPLISPVNDNAYFIVCDDDVIWGDRYFENMIRVVNEGFLATRNGRLITKEYQEIAPIDKIFQKDNQVCFNEDIEYDFGGHIWAGRISWLRMAWKYIPISLENCEDFWLSATLKTFYNIGTKTPKCPCPKDFPINPDLCAASEESANIHDNGIVGNKTVDHSFRSQLIKDIAIHLKYRPMLFSDSKALDKINDKFIFGNKEHPIFNLSDSLWKNALYWQ